MAWTLERGRPRPASQPVPEPFGGERSDWGLALAQAWALKGDSARARVYADSARVAFQHMISRSTRNDQNFALLGLSLAYLGRYAEAIAAGQQAIVPRNPRTIGSPGYNQFNLARIYAMAGRRDSAIATLERVLKIPLYVTPGWLRIDPTFASLRTDLRFQQLAAEPAR